jgi:tetratricopeptide (TPR) repeat protein
MRRSIAGAVALALVATACSRTPKATTQQQVNHLIGLGLQAQQSKEYPAALRDYLAVLKIAPGNAIALYDLGTLWDAQGNGKNAEYYYRRVIDVEPQYWQALYNLAILRSNAGATQEAVSLYRRVIAVAPKDASAYLNLGLLLLNAGDSKGSTKALNEALKLEPKLVSRLKGNGAVTSPTPTATAAP